jgi:hypothetical protein
MGKRLMIVAAAAAAVGLIGAPIARAGSASLVASKDNTLFENPDGLSSNGSGSYLFVGRTSTNGVRRALVAFDLPSAVPTNAFITSASLDVNVSRAILNSNATLHVVSQNWGEGASNAGDPGGGGTAAQTGDATWKHTFYNTGLWTNLGGDFNATASDTTSMGFGNASFSSTQMEVDVQNWINNPATNFGWLMKGDEAVSQSAKRLDSRESISGAGPTLTVGWDASTWNSGTSGAWGNNAKWLMGVPDGIGAEANFSFSTGTTATIAVSVDAPRTVGFLNFSTSNNYTFTGSAITLDSPSNSSQINVISGQHQIHAALNLDTVTNIAVDGGSSLWVSTGLTATAPNAIIGKNGAGTLRTTRVRGGKLIVSGGALVTDANGSPAGISVVDDLLIGAQATFDTADNDLIVNEGNYTSIRDLVSQGLGNTAGIISSTRNGTQILALFDNSLVGRTDWQGIPVALDAVIGKYTYFGDANIDGQVTGDDYTIVDANLNTTPADGVEWLKGDMNLDGEITGDDYTVIDAKLGLGVGNPLSPSQISAVPEPSALGFIAMGALSALKRRRS